MYDIAGTQMLEECSVAASKDRIKMCIYCRSVTEAFVGSRVDDKRDVGVVELF